MLSPRRKYISKDASQDACLRIVDVRGIMGRACAKQWLAHVQSNGARMRKALACACAKQWFAHVHSNGVRMAMVVFTCKYKCTIKGSELDVVLELHGHGLS